MYIIYQIAKFLVYFSFKIYFPKTTVLNLKYLKFDHPAIVVSNHPNTLLDPLNVAYRTKKQVYFLANASMFATKFTNCFFSMMYCIPIRRRKDKNSKISNEDSFARCDEFLGNGGCLFVAPEGVSVMQRGLRSVKKGTARIALSAAAKNNFQLGLKIVPVGLTYKAPNYFRTPMTVHVAEPIELNDFQTIYQNNPTQAVNQITELIAQRLSKSLILPADETEDQLLHKIEEITYNDVPLEGIAAYEHSKKLLQQLQQNKKAADTFPLWEQSINQYFKDLEQLKTNDKAVLATQQKKGLWTSIVLLIVGLPIFLYGLINNALPVLLTLAMTRKINTYVGYNSTIKILVGLFLAFPLFYSCQTYGIYQWSNTPWWALIYFISLIPMGILAWEYAMLFKQTRRSWRFKHFNKNQAQKAAALWKQRREIKEYFKPQP